MPIVVDSTCRHCGKPIEPLGVDGYYILSWIHVGVGASIHCPASDPLTFATPTMRVVPLNRNPRDRKA